MQEAKTFRSFIWIVGYRNKSKDSNSIHSVTEMNSMSKTITAIAMLKLISKISEVKAA